MTRSTVILFALIPLCASGGCALQKPTQPTAVLTTEDFIADPATLASQAEAPSANPTPATPLPPAISAAAASKGILNVTAVPGAPESSNAAPDPSTPRILIDAKVGELNGRPVRAERILTELGPLLSAKARERKLSRDEWAFMLQQEPAPGAEDKTITREQWMAFAQKAFAYRLNTELEDQLLAEEARFSLKPEQKQGLKYMVQEATEAARRETPGGSRAQSQQNLSSKGTSQREFERQRESVLLIGYELEEKLRKRIRTSWKDVQLYYERNPAEFNPPPIAHFRRIDVPAAKPDDIAAVQAALDAGQPFDKVASMPQNTYRAADGGRTPDQKFAGEYEKASFFSGKLEEAARTLKPGQFTREPMDISKDKTWLFLDSIERHNQPLSSAEVQLTIANRLNNQAFRAERANYIERLKQRATFTDIPAMAAELAGFAGARYWPKE